MAAKFYLDNISEFYNWANTLPITVTNEEIKVICSVVRS